MTGQSNRRRHYSSASSSADEDVAIDVVNESAANNKKANRHLNKKLNSNHAHSGDLPGKAKSESNTNNHQKSSSLNSSLNGSVEQKISKHIKTNGHLAATILHSPNSNSSSNSQFDASITTNLKTESAASLIANLDAEQAGRKFKSFLIEDILSQQKKRQQEQFQLLLAQQQQQLLLQQFNSNKLLQQHSAAALPSLSPSNQSTNQSSPNSSVHSLVNNSENSLNDSMNAAALAAYSLNSIIRPWDLANGLIPNSAVAATLSQLTAAQQCSSSLNSQSAGNSSLPISPSSHSLALTLGTNVQTATSPSAQQPNHLNGSSLLNSSNQLAVASAALAAAHSPNKLNMQQLSRFGSLANYPHLLPGNFASSLSHLSPHHQFLASLNGSSAAASLFPGLAAASNLTNNAAFSAALKADPAFRLHSLGHPFAGSSTLPTPPQQASSSVNSADASLMQHLINNSASSLTNGQPNKTPVNVNSNNATGKPVSKQPINENGKRLNVEDLDDECDENYDNDAIMNDDEDCDDKCSIASSTNGRSKAKPQTNGDGSSPLSALYELANKNFEMTRNEKSGKLAA